MHTLIIGAGAAGMAAAIAAARQGQRVTVLERGRKALKKLGVTGNGRGNLLNAGLVENVLTHPRTVFSPDGDLLPFVQKRYYGDPAFAAKVLAQRPWEQIAEFLQSCGIALDEEDEGRMYPSSYLASTAVEALLLEAEKLGVRIETCTRALRIEPGFTVHALRAEYAEDTQRKNGKSKPGALLGETAVSYRADRVIVTVGGAAAPMHGTDGTSYGLLSELGHTVTPLYPALCALTTEEPLPQSLAGQRIRCEAALSRPDGEPVREEGEVLFAQDGVSGIAAMQLARFVRPGCVLMLDLRRGVMGNQCHQPAVRWLQERAQSARNMGEVLVGAASGALSRWLLQRAGCSVSDAVTPERLQALAAEMECVMLPLGGTRGFEAAQVTAGGVRTAEFDPLTMESRLVPGVYAAGEVLDVDGACGGFNLMFAFASGIIAATGKH